MKHFANLKSTAMPIWRLMVLALILLAPAPVFAAGDGKTRFLSVIDDLPLMAGLTEAGDGVQFESPQGRIVEVSAFATDEATDGGNVDADALRDFYENSLPQLGWSKTGPGTYGREGEILKITIALPGDSSVLVVIFSIRPEIGG